MILKFLVCSFLFIFLILSGCVDENQGCFELKDEKKFSKIECDNKCIENDFVPCNHESRSRVDGYKLYQCMCKEGDVDSIECSYATADAFYSYDYDYQVIESWCDCERDGFYSSPEPMPVPGGGTWTKCNCYKCENFEDYKECFWDPFEDKYYLCIYENGTAVEFS